MEKAYLTEPCSVAYNSVVINSRIQPVKRVVVLGPGTIGLLCAAISKLCGAEAAMVGLESDQYRLGIARQYGCEAIVGDASEWARERDGLGGGVVMDAAGGGGAGRVGRGLGRRRGWVGWGRANAVSV